MSPEYELRENRKNLIRKLCAERGCWGDGTDATEESITAAANDPWQVGIDEDDLDSAIAGDVAAIANLRQRWGLPVLS